MQQMLQQIAASNAAKAASAKAAAKAPAKKAAGPAKKNPAKAATAPAKAPAKGKAKGKAAAQPQTGIKFAIADFARPAAGRALAAHTAAFLGLSGMGAGAAIPRALATKIIGARAVQYHTGNGNFAATAEGLKLTDKGELFFLSREIDPELLAAYESVMQTGAVNETANVKTEAARVKI